MLGALSNWHYMFLPTKLQSQRSFLLPQPIPLKVSLCLLARVPFFPVYSSSSPVFILLSTKLFSLFLSSSPSPHFIPLAFVTLSPALSWSFLDLLFRCHFSFTAALLWYFFLSVLVFFCTPSHTHTESPYFSEDPEVRERIWFPQTPHKKEPPAQENSLCMISLEITLAHLAGNWKLAHQTKQGFIRGDVSAVRLGRGIHNLCLWCLCDGRLLHGKERILS